MTISATPTLGQAAEDGKVAGWFDTHCHPLHPRCLLTAEEQLAQARRCGVRGFITAGTDSASSAAYVELALSERAAGRDDVRALAGVDPQAAPRWHAGEREALVRLLDSADASSTIVGIGEVGLDYNHSYLPRPVQREAFAAQIEMAHARDLTLVIHTRDAWEDTLAILEERRWPERTVIHCFTGSIGQAEHCVDRGAYVSISGTVTFASAHALRAAASAVPLERLLLETDTPYLTPAPYRRQVNTPSRVADTGAFLAELRGLGVAEFAALTTTNAHAAFALGHRRGQMSRPADSSRPRA